MSNELSGKTALVTGSTSGIGKAAAIKLAALGAHVVLTGRDQERGQRAIKEIIESGGQADFIALTLEGASSARELARQALAVGGGRIDILVNNAGVFPAGPTAETLENDFDAVLNVNVKAPYYLVGELAPVMVANGGGSIINVTTMVAEFGMAGMALYGASKAALVLLTKSWAAEFGAQGVRVNAVSPGPTQTEGTAVFGDEAIAQLVSTVPAGRSAQPEEIADAIVYLATERSSFVHGAILPVDGGRIAV